MNLVTSALFFTLAILFWLLSAGVGDASLTKAAGGWGFLVAALAFYDGEGRQRPASRARLVPAVCPCRRPAHSLPLPPTPHAPPAGTAQLMEEVYGRSILPLFPFKSINQLQLGNFGTRKRVDAGDLEAAKA